MYVQSRPQGLPSLFESLPLRLGNHCSPWFHGGFAEQTCKVVGAKEAYICEWYHAAEFQVNAYLDNALLFTVMTEINKRAD